MFVFAVDLQAANEVQWQWRHTYRLANALSRAVKGTFILNLVNDKQVLKWKKVSAGGMGTVGVWLQI